VGAEGRRGGRWRRGRGSGRKGSGGVGERDVAVCRSNRVVGQVVGGRKGKRKRGGGGEERVVRKSAAEAADNRCALTLQAQMRASPTGTIAYVIVIE
jgi:hypothetical protein